MRRTLFLSAFAVFATVAVIRGMGSDAGAQPVVIESPSFDAHLRYIGRDGATGLPARIDDRYIAAVEEDYANYGKVEAEAIPPPPAGEDDLARLTVPALGIDAPIERFGVDKFGRLDVPQDAVTTGWHPGFSNLPGSGASTFIAAHYMYANAPGVFFELATLEAGDEVSVGMASGDGATYRVVSVVDYPLASIDMGALLHGMEGVESLVLMTCSGPPNEGEYPFRTVVIATRITPG
jgi:LPXTG-site transpeptidase (sortase) family protein